MKKSIISLSLFLLFTAGCSSGAAADVPKNEKNRYPDFVVIPQPDEEDEFADVSAAVHTYENAAIHTDETEITLPDLPEVPIPEPSADQGQQTDQAIDPSEFDVSRLRFEDFDNLYGQITYIGYPEDRVRLPLGNANGLWKYNIKIPYESSLGNMFDEIGFAEMSVHDSDNPPVSIILHPRLATDGYEVWEETDEEVGYAPFSGGLDDNKDLKLYGNDRILELKEYYASEGNEYLIAVLWISDESYAEFLMIRGQE